MIENHDDHTSDGVLVQRARALVALGQRFPEAVVSPTDFTADPLDELIFVVLAQHTVPFNARSAYAQLRRRYPTWIQLIEAPLTDIAETIRAAGLAQRRASLLQRLVARVQTDFPEGSLTTLRTWDDQAVLTYLTSLPGVGPFAALQVMLYALDRRVLPVAWRLTRLLTRLGIVDRMTEPESVLHTAASLLTTGQHRQLYDNLLTHAHDVCTPRLPHCRRCHLTDLCAHYQRTRHMQEAWTRRTSAASAARA